MRKVVVTLDLSVEDCISKDDLEDFFNELESDMQERFSEIPYDYNNENVFINDVKIR